MAREFGFALVVAALGVAAVACFAVGLAAIGPGGPVRQCVREHSEQRLTPFPAGKSIMFISQTVAVCDRWEAMP